MSDTPMFVLATTLNWNTMQPDGLMCFRLKDIKWARLCKGYVDVEVDNSYFVLDMSKDSFMTLIGLLDNMES